MTFPAFTVFLRHCVSSVLSGASLSKEEAFGIVSIGNEDLPSLFAASHAIRRHFRNNSVDLCSIVNAKSGACSEDCSYCAQSSRSRAEIPVYPLLEDAAILDRAGEAAKKGVRRFCIVTSGRRVSKTELKRIGELTGRIRTMGLLPCATLGLLGYDDLKFLKDSGLERFHHNLETSENYFSRICTTHSYADKLRTIEAVKKAGLSLCSGGIFGMGESWEDRIDMAFSLRELGADSVPVNFLTPVEGTPLAGRGTLPPLEALTIIALYRLILPDRQIRVCGGRVQTLGELNPLLFWAGADGLLVGNYLTTLGRDVGHDLALINSMGLSVEGAPGNQG